MSEESVREEARQAGVENPTVFVYLPKLEADVLQQAIGQFRAAEETVNTRAVPQTNPGVEAKGAMQSRTTLEEKRVSDLVDDIIKGARVYQGGGNQITDGSFPELVRQAVDAALTRLFPKFPDADQLGWNNVFRRAEQGAPDPLSAVGYASDADKHSVCQEVRGFRRWRRQKGFRGTPEFFESSLRLVTGYR